MGFSEVHLKKMLFFDFIVPVNYLANPIAEENEEGVRIFSVVEDVHQLRRLRRLLSVPHHKWTLMLLVMVEQIRVGAKLYA